MTTTTTTAAAAATTAAAATAAAVATVTFAKGPFRLFSVMIAKLRHLKREGRPKTRFRYDTCPL